MLRPHPSDVVLQRVADGDVARLPRAVLAHVAACARCARWTRETRSASAAVRRTLGGETPGMPPDALLARVLASLRGDSAPVP